MANYCTVAQVKALISATESGDDALLAVLVTRASALVDQHTGRTFADRSETRTFTPGTDTDGLTLLLDDDLISITTLTNGDGTVIAAASYKLLPLNHTPKHAIRLLASSGLSWTYTDDAEGAISVNGKWGYCLSASCPADVVQATARLALWLYRQREAPFSRVGNVMTGEYEVPVAMPDDVQKMLQPYLRPVWGGA